MKFLAQSGLEAFLGFLAQSARVVAPVKKDGVVQYQVWTPGTAVELDVLLAKQSPKEYVFPQSEACLSFLYTMACPAVKPMSTEEARVELEEGEGGEVFADPLNNFTVEELTTFVEWMVASAFVEPKVSMTRKDGEKYIGDLDDQDKEQVMELLGLSLAG